MGASLVLIPSTLYIQTHSPDTESKYSEVAPVASYQSSSKARALIPNICLCCSKFFFFQSDPQIYVPKSHRSNLSKGNKNLHYHSLPIIKRLLCVRRNNMLKVTQVGQGHMGSMWWKRDSSPGLSDPKVMNVTT